MRASVSALKLFVTYGACVLAMSATLIGWSSFANPEYRWTSGDLWLSIELTAIFGLPIYAIVGMPYLAIGGPAWGFEHRIVFVAIGTVLGGLAGAAYGAVLAMPLPIPPFMPIAGILAGFVSSLIWLLLHRSESGAQND
jgi:hypothetical protein